MVQANQKISGDSHSPEKKEVAAKCVRQFGLATHQSAPPQTTTYSPLGIPPPAGETVGWMWHLIDRDGNKWPFPGEDNGKFITPFEVVGFAEGGKSIIAYDDNRLFSLPVVTIKGEAK